MTLEEIQIKLGKKIVNLRNAKSIKQVHLAERIGIEDSALRRIEKGKTNVTLKTLLKISDALEISIPNLLDFEDKK